MTAPVASLPCDLGPKDIEILQRCQASRRSIPGRTLTRSLWLHLLLSYAQAREGMDPDQHQMGAVALFEEGQQFEGVFIGEPFPYRERAAFHRQRLTAEGRTFQSVGDFKEWFLVLFSEAVKNDELSFGMRSAAQRLEDATPLFDALNARRRITLTHDRQGAFAAVYQATLYYAPGTSSPRDPYAFEGWALQEVFMPQERVQE